MAGGIEMTGVPVARRTYEENEQRLSEQLAEDRIRKDFAEWRVLFRDLRPDLTHDELRYALRVYRECIEDPISQAQIDSYAVPQFWNPDSVLLGAVSHFGKGVSPAQLMAVIGALRIYRSTPVSALAGIALNHFFAVSLWGDVAVRSSRESLDLVSAPRDGSIPDVAPHVRAAVDAFLSKFKK